jgi:hypothetical protein
MVTLGYYKFEKGSNSSQISTLGRCGIQKRKGRQGNNNLYGKKGKKKRKR